MTTQHDEIFAVFEYMIPFYPSWTLSMPTIEAYIEALSDLNVIGLRAAAVQLCRNAKFFPSMAEMRSAGLRQLVNEDLDGWRQALAEISRRREELKDLAFEGEVDLDGFDALYGRAWQLGAWDVAKRLRAVQQSLMTRQRLAVSVSPWQALPGDGQMVQNQDKATGDVKRGVRNG